MTWYTLIRLILQMPFALLSSITLLIPLHAVTCPLAGLQHSFLLLPTVPDEVIFIFKAFKAISAGLDNINAYHIKVIAQHIANVLSVIINLIFKTGVFLWELKRGRVTPVFKKGDRMLTQNYRPI